MLHFPPIIISNLPSTLFHFGLAFILVYASRFIVRSVYIRLALRNVPGPPSTSLLWGEEWHLYHCDPGSLYIDWHKRFGKVVKFTGAFGHQVLSITDPRAITYILCEATYQFPKPDGVRAWFRALLGEGIVWVEGKDAHEKQRRSLMPALTQQSIRDLMPIFYETSTKLVAQWSRQIDANRDEVKIEVTNWAGRFALETIGRAAFSYDFDCLSGKPHALAETLDGLTNNKNDRSSFYIRALLWLFPPILSIGKKGQMIRQTRRELGDIVLKMWQDAKVAGDPDGKTFMSLMLRADNAISASPMTEEEIVAQIRTVISAGYETVSATICWLLYELAMNPQLQKDLREELTSAGEPSFDKLNTDYPLLDATLRETLRMHPAVLENHHVAAETIVVPLLEPLSGSSDTHIVIPKGTILSMPVNVIHRDPNTWGPDADVFAPERWLLRKEIGIYGRRELFAFSEGPRGCPGRPFAFAEIKALAVTLVRQFSFSCPHEIESFQSFVIRPRVKGQGLSSLPLLVRKVVF